MARAGRIAIKPISGALGAEIEGADLSKPLDNEVFSQVHQALLDHLVVFFRDQEITPAQHVAFARGFGEIDLNPFVRPLELEVLPDHPEVLNIVKEPAETLNFGGVWHHDVSYREKPNFGSVLVARESPRHGGDTMWANQYLAYETLSDGLKRMIEGMRAVHSSIRGYDADRMASLYSLKKEELPEASIRRSVEKAEKAEAVHPVVRTHPETRRKCLFVNRSYTMRFEGWTDEESKTLLDVLYAHSVRPEFTCRFRWREGSVALWDNRAAMHYALNDYRGQRRVMHRVAIHGDRPI
jgi:taurine dioxygenase